MKHAIFLSILALYILVGGQNWHQYFAVVMIVTWFRYGGKLSYKVW